MQDMSQSDYPTKPAIVTRQPDPRVHPVGVNACPDDVELFHVFRTQVASRVAFGLDQAFWNRDLLQAAHVHPALWHAILAMAATHKALPQLLSDPPSETEDVLTLKHHHLSIKHMLNAATQSDELSYLQKEMMLMAAVLLTTICSLRRYLPEALVHAKNGLRLYYRWKFWQYLSVPGAATSPLGVLRSDSLILLMEFLEFQTFTFTFTSERPKNIKYSAWARSSPNDAFSCLIEAYFALQLLMNQSIHAWSEIRRDYLARRQGPLPDPRLVYRRGLSQWRYKFNKLRQLQTQNMVQVNIVRRLELYCCALEMMLYSDCSEPAFSALPPDSVMEHMVELVEKVFTSETELDESYAQDGPASFFFSLSIAPQIGALAIFSRNSRVRQRFISLLNDWPRAESIWCGKLIAAMTESVQLVEGEGLTSSQQLCCRPPCTPGEYVCFQHRVMSSYISVNKDGDLEHRIQTIGDIQHGLPERIFMWKYLNNEDESSVKVYKWKYPCTVFRLQV
ncbi:hypothetical protein NLG97_g2249 [Lecanicillium saksenae]|uniref:Uncharacterized protein n=1 Tax=Lecanicillium saksenae TaxID=468837 RepID=A0ACC1R382_9HYPO|nr:hypothetical protein NLG97_g2249 [Lecanicillium saksenae]